MAQTVIDVAVRTKGTNELEQLQSRMLQLERQVAKLQGTLPQAANGIRGLGNASKAASGGIRTVGAALQAALGPIAAVTGAVGALTAAFQTIATQDFAEAKVRTLGTNSQELVAELQKVSAELKGQASVAELTAAAYDVASAGFVKAADAALVLKAASLGAVGGFSDINTVGNAATSVLNAYGLAASDAALVVDRFIQTQNDGKIVVAEYAQNIGKVASAAAGLQIPLEEVNAIIAQSTAAGVQAEVAFTGVKTALARLASGEASKVLEDYGISIDAASIASDGLYGTLAKLEKLDTGALFKALGTEAAPALLPVIQNLERFQELIDKQESSAGAAARAQAEAANTIQGAWKAVQTELSNLFADQSELGTVLKVTLQAAAAAVKIFGQTLNVLLAPIKAIIDALSGIARAADEAFNISATIDQANAAARTFQDELGTIRDEFLADLAGAFDPIVDLWGQAMDAIVNWWDGTTQSIGYMADELGGWIQGVWNGIASGAQNIISPIINAFKAAFDGAWNIIMGFWNSLPGWLKGALSAAGSVAGGVASAVTSALNKVGTAINKGIAAAGKAGQGKTGPGQISYKAPSGGGSAAPAGGGGGGGGKGGGKGASDKAAREAEREAQLTAKQLKSAQDRLFAAEQLLARQQDLTKQQEIQLTKEQEIAKIQREYSDLLAKVKSVEEESALEKARGLEIKAEELKAEEALKELREGALSSLQEENALLQAKLAGKEEEYLLQKKINDLVAAGGGTVSRGEATALAEANQQLTKQVEAQDKAKASAEALAGSISSALTDSLRGLIDGSMTAEEALSNAFKGIADAFIDMAMQMIQQWLQMQLMGLFKGAFGGAFGGGGMGMGFTPFADGGFVSSPTPALIGEGGSNEYVIPENKMGSAMQRWNAGARGDAVVNGADPSGGGGGAMTPEQPAQINISGGITQFGGENYIRQDQLPSILAQAGKLGESRALRRLQMSGSTRRKVGI